MKLPKIPFTSKGALLSGDELHRLVLHRSWRCLVERGGQIFEDPSADYRALIFIMLNPSKADATRPDPTLDSCVRIANAQRYGNVLLGNLWTYRSTDWKALRDETLDRNTPESDDTLVRLFTRPQDFLPSLILDYRIVFAWGSRVQDVPGAAWRIQRVMELFNRSVSRTDDYPWCLGTTQSGNPNHPLFLSATTPLEPWDGVCTAKG